MIWPGYPGAAALAIALTAGGNRPALCPDDQSDPPTENTMTKNQSLFAGCSGKVLRHVLRATLPLLALSALPLPATAQPRWMVCAEEGQVCRFDGEAMVRFGTPGRYAFAPGQNRILCDTEQFGDPAPGQPKRCEVSTNWRDDERYRDRRDQRDGHDSRRGGVQGDNWRACANEGHDCRIDGQANVRFGANGRYEVRQVSAGILRCDTNTFGDPAPGVVKRCEVQATGPQWLVCAREGEYCRLPGPARVRYGANGRHVERQETYGLACNNATFGDPAPETAKLCEYMPASATTTMPTPVAAPQAATAGWQYCSAEGGSCQVQGPSLLRYGAGGNYAYRETSVNMTCNNASFGGDPAEGQQKQCHALRLGR